MSAMKDFLSNCRVQLIFCKDNANECNESLLSNCRVQLILCKDNAFMGYIQKYCLNFDKKSLRLSRAGGMIKQKMYEEKMSN